MVYSLIYLFYFILLLVHTEVSVTTRNNVVLGDTEMLTKEKSVPQRNCNRSMQQEKGESSKSTSRISTVSVQWLIQ